jgi:hypothetical protein
MDFEEAGNPKRGASAVSQGIVGCGGRENPKSSVGNHEGWTGWAEAKQALSERRLRTSERESNLAEVGTLHSRERVSPTGS